MPTPLLTFLSVYEVNIMRHAHGHRAESQSVKDGSSGAHRDSGNDLGSEAAKTLSSPGGNDTFRANVQHTETTAGRQVANLNVVDEKNGSPRRKLASEKSPSDLASPASNASNTEKPAFIDKTRDNSDKFKDAGDGKKDNPNSPPKISVELENKENSSDKEPHFVVKKNGDIEMLGDPERLKSKEVRVVLERDQGDVNPTEQQKKAADELVTYLNDRMKKNFPQEAGKIQLDDKNDLISPSVENKLRKPPDQEQMTPETRKSVARTRRLDGSGGMDMPRAATEGQGSFETRGVPRQKGENDKTAAMKEAVAGLFKPESDRPYETIRKHPHGDYRVGRYGLSGNQLSSWIDSLSPEQIEKLIAEGKLPKNFADPKFLEKFKATAQKMAKGEQPSESDLKQFLPKEAQETIAGQLMDQFGAKVGSDPGKISAAMMSGNTPDKLTQEDLSSPGAQELAKAGQKLYDIATSRQHVDNGSGAFRGDKVPEGSRRSLIEKALQIAGERITESTIAALNTIVKNESSWNPNARNNWDINAKRGIPSQGLAQTIPPTFNTHKDKTGQVEAAGQSNTILNPLANLVAAVNYSQSRYGGIERVPGVVSTRRGGGYRPY